jgi:hypothetical protein
MIPPQNSQAFVGMPKVYGQEERYGLKSLFLSHRQKVMRELLEKRSEMILQGNDLNTWNQKKRKADYSFYALVLQIPFDLYIIFKFRGKQA